MSTLLIELSLLSDSQHSRVREELNVSDDSAFSAAWLSEHMKIISSLMFLFIIRW